MPTTPKFATFDLLLDKTPRTKLIELTVTDDQGKETKVAMKVKALGFKDYDDLVGEHPPNKAQIKDGNQWDPETFPPALLSACAVSPGLTVDEATAIWESDSWSRGELMDVFVALIKLNSDGLNIPFTSNGSE